MDFEPAHYALTPDGQYLLLANRDADKVVVWNWEKDEAEKRMSVQGGPCYIYVRGDTAYVANGKVATLSEIDLGELKVVSTIDLVTGQPYCISGAADPNSPLFITCGEYTNRQVIRLDPAKETCKAIHSEMYMSVFTISANGNVGIKQSEFSNSPSGTPTIFEMAANGDLGKQLSYQHDSFGLLRSDSKGKYWIGSGGVWDATISKQVAKIDAFAIAEHPSQPVLATLKLDDRPWDASAKQATLAFVSNTKFTGNFTRMFELPPSKMKDSYATGMKSIPNVEDCNSSSASTPAQSLRPRKAAASTCRIGVRSTAYPMGRGTWMERSEVGLRARPTCFPTMRRLRRQGLTCAQGIPQHEPPPSLHRYSG